MFLQQDARYGPNKPEKLPGRKRDRDRAAKRAERAAAGLPAEEEEGMDVDEPTTSPTTNEFTASSFNTPSQPITSSTTTTSEGLLSSPVRPDQTPSTSTSTTTTTTPRYPAHSSNITPIGRPRTRPLVEVGTLQELAHLDVDSLPTNVRGMSCQAITY
jgi:hypothetical protein